MMTKRMRILHGLQLIGLVVALGLPGLAYAEEAAEPTKPGQPGTRVVVMPPCSVEITTDGAGHETEKLLCKNEQCIKQCKALRAQAARRASAASIQPLVSTSPAPAAGSVAHPLPALTSEKPANVAAPVTAASCDAGGCWGSNGQRYSNSGTTTLQNSQGRLCTKNGVFIQCF